MNNNLAIFQYTDQEVRFFPSGDSFEVAAIDISQVLEYSNTQSLLNLIDEDLNYKGVAFFDTLGGKQQLITLKEPGLYQALARSNKPKAKPFQKWLFERVLPEIRRTGSYSEKVVVPIDILQDLIHQLNPSELKAWLYLYEKSLNSPDGKVVLSSDCDIATAIGIQARTWYRAKKKFAELGLFHFEKPVRYLTLRDLSCQ